MMENWRSSNRKLRTLRKSRKKYEIVQSVSNGTHNFYSEEKPRQVVSPTLHLRKGKRKVVQFSSGCPYKLRPVAVLDKASDESKHSRDAGEPCVRIILSDSEDEDVDKGSEARGEKYAIMALNFYNKYPSENFELVETGLLSVGYISTGRLLHLNFKAMKRDETDAAVQTFFAELTKTNRGVVTLDSILSMGPSDLLPEKANTRGCLYCRSSNIHHPNGNDTFQRGGEDHWPTLCSQIRELNTYIEEGLKKREKEEEEFIPRFSHPRVEYFDKKFEDSEITTVALRLFNEREGGQSWSHFLSDEPDTCGCLYCDHYPVYHPPGSGYLTGREA